MRLWHKDLIQALPRQQLLSQWRECVCIAKNCYENGFPNHILVNKVTWFNKSHFYAYCCLVVNEMHNRNYKVSEKSINKLKSYFSVEEIQVSSRIEKDGNLFEAWHNDRYLIQCFFNLQEKYDCGGITEKEWKIITDKVAKLGYKQIQLF